MGLPPVAGEVGGRGVAGPPMTVCLPVRMGTVSACDWMPVLALWSGWMELALWKLRVNDTERVFLLAGGCLWSH